LAKRTWRIVGYDSAREIFARDAPGNLSEPEMRTILQRLACRHLSDDEVVLSSLRRNKGKRPMDHLDLARTDGIRGGWMTGGNPYYVATLRDLNDA
jgi:hypothetical protein